MMLDYIIIQTSSACRNVFFICWQLVLWNWR